MSGQPAADPGEARIRLVVEFEHQLRQAARAESSDGDRALSAHLSARRARTTSLYCPACDVAWPCRAVTNLARDLLGLADINRHLDRQQAIATPRAGPVTDDEQIAEDIARKLAAAGVGSVRRVSSPADRSHPDRWAVLLDKPAEARTATGALRGMDGVTGVRRGEHQPTLITFKLQSAAG